MKTTPETWTRKKSEAVADCRVFKVREDFCENEANGKTANFFVVENPDWVNIVAVTKERQVVLIEQFRHGAEEIILEIPGGMVDESEDRKVAAERELTEETGYTSEEFIFLGKSRPNPAIQNNWIYHFAALNCEKTAATDFDEHESVMTKLVPLTEIENLIADGKFTHSLAITAFYYLTLTKIKL